jgi:K+-sensing histidine kinase KdpD
MTVLVSDHHSHREEVRPDPEELLRRYHLCEREGATGVPTATASQAPQPQETRGQLRIYLGAAAGVGKIYAMLSEGQRRKKRGIDVVVGYVETHGRQETQAQLGDLEVLPRKQVPYRGVMLEEMDTEALIARHPRLALIDELAHTNAPSSRHEKRYQDVQEVLSWGIDVLTTLNVEHLETLHDLVASITGREVRETVPDRLLEQADEKEGNGATTHQAEARHRLQESVRLAEDLGAEILQISSGESARALLESARERHITRLVLGQPVLSRWEVLLGGSVLLHMLRLNTEIDLHLVPVCQ